MIYAKRFEIKLNKPKLTLDKIYLIFDIISQMAIDNGLHTRKADLLKCHESPDGEW
jgi:hypothetical protein